MLSRKILFTLAASVAAVGIALAPVAASAKQHSSHHSGSKHHSSHKHGKHHHKHHKHAHHHHKHHKHHHWHHKKYYYPGTETTYEYESSPTTYSKPTYTYSKPADNCTCLTKEYTEDGSVVFKDVCTKESAINSSSKKTAEADD